MLLTERSKMKKAAINKIIPFSNVDGAGNRLSIFFQTCPFTCLFCHNPETINPCIHCGICVPTCPSGALAMQNGKVVWDPAVCIDCDTCIKVCPHMASPKIRYMDAEEVLAEIKQVQPFIRGITVSGGECMNHAWFLEELFPKVQALGLTCLIDSNGAYDFAKYSSLLAQCDGVMLDVKAFDPKFHEEITGSSNAMVLHNLRYLLSAGKLTEVRTILYPGMDLQNERTVSAVASLIQDQCDYKLIRYRPYGVRDEGLAFFGNRTTSEEELKKFATMAHAYGANRIIAI